MFPLNLEEHLRAESTKFTDPRRLPELAAAVGATFAQQLMTKRVKKLGQQRKMLRQILEKTDAHRPESYQVR